MALMGLRSCLSRGNARPTARQLAKLMTTDPRDAAGLLQVLEDLAVIRHEGEPWRYVVNPAAI